MQACYMTRAECFSDTSRLYSTFVVLRRSRVVSIYCSQPEELFPDFNITFTLQAENAEDLSEGLASIVAALRKEDDLHVMIEALKPAELYDGERDGPFASGHGEEDSTQTVWNNSPPMHISGRGDVVRALSGKPPAVGSYVTVQGQRRRVVAIESMGNRPPWGVVLSSAV